MFNKRLFAYYLLFAFCFLLAFTPALAQEEEEDVTDDDVNRVAKQLFCPTCENTPVDVCPTQTCSDWRDLIRQQLEEGRSDEEVLDYFAAQYGPQVLANAPREGFGLFLWIAPIVVVLGGIIFFARYMSHLQQVNRRQGQRVSGRKAEADENDLPPAEGDYRRRLEDELNRQN
ncbi:MAG: cytochrome c-type biogenesis protein CcmH [Anaerolineales bacterium]|nr:cytochrome c-type biogenesis protein CcmH [Anaerolineales bacterium]